jgi:type II secretory pathway component PulF
MPEFIYSALKVSGEKVEGTLTASSRAEALARLDRSGIQPLKLTERSGAGSSGKPRSESQRDSRSADNKADPSQRPIPISARALTVFTEELGSLLAAGLQLEPALAIIGRSQFGPGVKDLAARLRAAVRDGQSFSAAMRRNAKGAVSPLYTTLIAAGERSGSLPTLIARLASHLKEATELRAKLLQALIYPAFLMTAGVLLVFLFMTVLMPQMTSLLATSGRKLPPSTAFLIAIGNFMSHWWWVLIVGAITIVVSMWRLRKIPSFRETTDRLLLKIPFLGGLLRAGFLSQLTLTLATLLSNGVTLVNALDLMRGLSNNVVLRRQIERASQEVSDGATLSGSLRRSPLFPPLLCDVVGVGEQTGDLPGALERVSERYSRELTAAMQRLLAMIQPLIILMLAGVVLMIAWALVSGIAESISSLRFQKS